MSELDSLLSKACSEISKNLLLFDEPSKQQVKEEIRIICRKYSLSRMPKSHEILSSVKGDDFSKLKKSFTQKTDQDCIRSSSSGINAQTICMSSWKMFILSWRN